MSAHEFQPDPYQETITKLSPTEPGPNTLTQSRGYLSGPEDSTSFATRQARLRSRGLLGLLIGRSRFVSCLCCIFLRGLCRLSSLLCCSVGLVGPLCGCLSCGECLICLHSSGIGARLSPCNVVPRRATRHQRRHHSRRQEVLHRMRSHCHFLSCCAGCKTRDGTKLSHAGNDGSIVKLSTQAPATLGR
jgi:hypothetical protein